MRAAPLPAEDLARHDRRPHRLRRAREQVRYAINAFTFSGRDKTLEVVAPTAVPPAYAKKTLKSFPARLK